MDKVSRLPPAEIRQLRLGYLRLTDSAPLLMAQELGLYQKYGLEVTLCREVSWANVRDKLVTGDLDAAQMLAPLPLAVSLGVGGMRADVISGLALSLNGNAITFSLPLARELQERGGNPQRGADTTAQAFAQYLREGERRITLAAAHTFSGHTLLLRRWLASAGIDPERDVHIIVLPPEQMFDSLARGIVDGFCVGEPWNSIAVLNGVGAVQATGYQVWNNSVEKVLGVTDTWHRLHPGSHLRLRLALMEACAWLAEPVHRQEAVAVLARYLGLPEEALRPSLTGNYCFAKGEEPVYLPDFHVFGRYQAGFPWRSDGEWLLQQIGELLGKPFSPDELKSQVQRALRTDLYREAARHLGMPSPSRDHKPLDCHDQPWEIEPGIQLGPDRMLSLPAARK